MRLTVLFEPRPWIKRRACSRSRTVAPVLHYFRVLRGALRHHQKKSSTKWISSLCVVVTKGLMHVSFLCKQFRVSRKSVSRTGSIWLEIWSGNTLSTSFEKTCMRQFHTFPCLNDVWWTLNTGLYHDQSLFNQFPSTHHHHHARVVLRRVYHYCRSPKPLCFFCIFFGWKQKKW